MKLVRFYRSLRRAEPQKKWSLDLPLLLIALYSLLYGWVLPHFRPPTPLPIYLAPQIFFLLACAAAAWRYRLAAADLGLSRFDAGQNLKVAAIALAVPVAAVLLLFGPLLLWRIGQSTSLAPLFAGQPLRYPLSAIVQMVLLAPLAEELFFRGLLLPPLEREIGALLSHWPSERRRKLAQFWGVTLASALLFSLAHGYVKFGAFLLGLGTAWIYLKTGSILPCIILHAVGNGWGPFLAYYFPGVFHYVAVFFR